jgi:putative membrane protein
MTALASLAALADGAGQGAHPLVHLNAALNVAATVLLLVALWHVKHRRFAAHGKTMLAAIVVSAAFLVSYLTYHAIAGNVRFTHPGPARYVYYTVLLTHVLLAFTVPFLVVIAAWQGAGALGWRPLRKGRFGEFPESQLSLRRHSLGLRHKRLVRWAYPIWLYVSITGVAVYVMLYHLWPSADL